MRFPFPLLPSRLLLAGLALAGSVLRAATPNTSQTVDLAVSGQKVATLAVPNSQGLWADTPAVEVELPAGPQVLRLTVPSQRGLALKQIELRAR